MLLSANTYVHTFTEPGKSCEDVATGGAAEEKGTETGEMETDDGAGSSKRKLEDAPDEDKYVHFIHIRLFYSKYIREWINALLIKL